MAASRKSPSTERLPSAVADCLGRYASDSDRFVVGLSGGVDSVVLLHALLALKRPVSAIHVHHGLSVHADRWTAFCRNLCSEWGVSISVERVDVERGSDDGLEAAARRARHAAFDRVSGDWMLLAHHRGDRAETVLFNLLRGAGVRGAGAMRECNGRLLRPLLEVCRADIVEYASAYGLSWMEDESNADVRHSRNFLRHRVLPLMRQRFPAVEERLTAAAGRFAEAADLLDQLALTDLGERPSRLPVSASFLAELAEPRARNVLRFLLTREGVGIPGEDRFIEAVRQFRSAGRDRHPAIVFGPWRLCRRGDQIVLEKGG